MRKFENKCVFICALGETTARRLNEYGREGWELVAVNWCWHYLKRTVEK